MTDPPPRMEARNSCGVEIQFFVVIPPLNSEILCVWNFNAIFDLLPVFRWQWCIEIKFKTILIMTTYLRVDGKLSEQHINVSFFLNCLEKVLKTMGQIWPLVFYFSWPSPRNWRTTIHWNVVRIRFPKPWDMWSWWKIVGNTFQCIIVFQFSLKRS